MRSNQRWRRRCAAIAAVTLLLVLPLRAEIIDRILAVVSGGLILQSDAIAATRLGLVNVPEMPDRIQGALDQLIERRLMLVEVDRYGPPEPSAAEIDAGVAAAVAKLAPGDSLEAIFRATGYSTEQLRLYVRDDLRIRAYLQQRFGQSSAPTDDEILQYYRSHESAFTAAGALRPFEQVRDAARDALITERRAALLRDWIAGLRRRADVNVLYIPIR
jgi:hypothetical protein